MRRSEAVLGFTVSALIRASVNFRPEIHVLLRFAEILTLLLVLRFDWFKLSCFAAFVGPLLVFV